MHAIEPGVDNTNDDGPILETDTRPKRRADFDRRLLELAGPQHYVVARGQLLEFGSARQIEYRIQTGLLERVYEGVYRIAGSPRTWHQQLLAACLASSGANG